MSGFKHHWSNVPRWVQIVVYSILGVIGVVVLGALFGFIIMWLWNWLMPMLFRLPEINYWQGIGIFVLAKILFGSIGGSGDSSKRKEKKDRAKPHGGTCGKERDGAEYYDEWWESEGKQAFEDYVKDKQDE